MKHKAILLLIVLIALTLTGCKEKDVTGPVFENVPEVLTFEFKTDVDLLDLGITADDNFDGDLSNDITINMDKDITEIGVYDVVYTVTDEVGNTTELSLQIVIEDTTAPVIIINPDNERTLFGIGADEPNWKLYIGLEDDDYDPSDDYGTRLSIDTTNVDMSSAGEFEVLITFTDISGNTSNEVSVRVFVIEIE